MGCSMKKICILIFALHLSVLSAAENFFGSFAEPIDGGNLDVNASTFDGTVAVLSPRWHESEALGGGAGGVRWRNMMFAIRGVKGRIVTFRLPMMLPGSNVMVHNMDTVTLHNVHPVWSADASQRRWQPFTKVTRYGPTGAGSSAVRFPWDSAAVKSTATVSTSASRREDYGWEFRNTEPFTEDVVYVSINEHAPVQEFYDWLESDVFTNGWVSPTASEASPGTFMIGYQSGAPAQAGGGAAFTRDVPDMPLYAFRIQEPGTSPKKLVLLVSGQHPYEGQTKAALRGAVEWILDRDDPSAAAFRREYAVIVYPFVNPTGDYAGLWRGTAYNPRKDTNRNWNTTLTNPTADRGIDTVIIHKNAMVKDVAAEGLGQPYAVFDFHQNFGDRPATLDYALHVQNSAASAYVAKLNKIEPTADITATTDTTTLRGWWTARGASMVVVFERSTYHTLASEHAFGRSTMQALAADLPPVVIPPEVEPEPEAAPELKEPLEVLHDDFTGSGSLAGRRLETGATWQVGQGAMTIAKGVGTSSADYLRAIIDAGRADGAVEGAFTLLGSDAYAGLVMRATDTSSFLIFRIKTTGWVFARVSANTSVTLASDSGKFALNTPHRLRVEMKGSEFKFFINGTLVRTATESSNKLATRVGVSSGTKVKFAVSDFLFERSADGDELASKPASPSATPVLVRDSFAGSGALGGRTPEQTVNNARWSLTQGTMNLVNGVAKAPTTDYVRAEIDTGVSDGLVQGRIKLLGNNAYAGLTFRVVDRANFLFFRLKPDAWVFAKVQGGKATTVASGARRFAVGTAYTLRADFRGEQINLAIDGVQVFSGRDTTHRSATKVGASNGTLVGFELDDFLAER